MTTIDQQPAVRRVIQLDGAGRHALGRSLSLLVAIAGLTLIHVVNGAAQRGTQADPTAPATIAVASAR